MSILETPSMKHVGRQYFQSLLVKEQATEKKPFWIREKCKNMRDGSRFDLINCHFSTWFSLLNSIWYRLLFFLVL
jgi:hypothetical protein